MPIISQNQQDEELFNTITSFFKIFKIGDLLRKCNACKQKGVPVLDIFKYKLCNVFCDRSMYMQMKTNSFQESFSKNTFYRFLDSTKTNWLRFTTLLSKKVIDSLEPLTSDDRINAFIIDDSLFERTSCKKTELGAKVFDHCDRRYKKGFRLLSLLWTDGNTAVPVNSCLMIQKQAEERMDRLTSQMAKSQGVNEALKASDQMKWVGLMNNIRASAEEIVLSELIYS